MEKKPYRILRIPFLNVNGFLVYRDNEAILVDTGHKKMEEQVIGLLPRLGLKPSSVKLILLTHTHFDHAGSARTLRKLTGAPVAVQREEADWLRNGWSVIPPGTRWKGKIISWIGRHFTPWLQRIDALEPDIIFDEQMDLSPYGFQAYALHTPGHTPGSSVVVMSEGEILAGDTVMGIRGKEHFPPYAWSCKSVLESWEKLLDLPARILFPAHGEKFMLDELKAEWPAAFVKYGYSPRKR